VLVSQMEMGMNFVQPNAQFPVLHKSLSLDIKGIKTDIVISRYEDNFLSCDFIRSLQAIFKLG
ncbi:hypothetical protein E2562_031451, partial [Oryza meyeriana var. granulata]